MITQSAVARRPDFKRHWRRFAKYTPPRRASCVDLPRQTCKWRSKFTWLAKYADRRRVSTQEFTPFMGCHKCAVPFDPICANSPLFNTATKRFRAGLIVGKLLTLKRARTWKTLADSPTLNQ